ncbi:MAG: hypothetical protein J2P31_06890 [Blastocatellia bacterium]|nr:hypothetical protein [Blastocatellia bacterium]
MIENERQLNQTRNAIRDLEAALMSLKKDIYSVNPQRFFLMAEPIIEQIQDLRAKVDEYTGLASALGYETEVWLCLEGRDISLGSTPTSIFSAMIDILRRGVQTVAEYLQQGGVRARPTDEIKQACDLRIVGLTSGSVKVGLRLPAASELNADNDLAAKQAMRALDIYLKTVEWVGSGEDLSLLEKEIPDKEHRRLLLNQVSRIIPRPRGGVEVVGFSGKRLLGRTVRLRREDRDRVREAIEKTLTEEWQIVEGTLREIDLDSRSFIIRNPSETSETRCSISQTADDLLDIAKEALDHKVIVMGTRKTDQTRRLVYPLSVFEIQVLDQELEDSQ